MTVARQELSGAEGRVRSPDHPSGWTAEHPTFTPEQIYAIERRHGNLFLDAAAGSGKTSVLVERFVKAVLKDGVNVSSILTITFTDKAAAEMRERIRARLRKLGAVDAARATGGAYISTIHGFCARMLRTHALAAGIDPAFTVLDELEAGRLADAAFDSALADVAEHVSGGVQAIASYGPWDLRTAIQSVYGELRSRGELRPRLPTPPDARDLAAARGRLQEAATRAAAELGAIANPSARVAGALERLERLPDVVADGSAWPGDLTGLRLPGGNGAALTTEVCLDYGEALGQFREACADRWAGRALGVLDRLLVEFGLRYEQRKRERSGLDFEDLELLCRELLRSEKELCDRYRDRFELVMVDELQDTNSVQLELIDSISRGNLFTVGDGQQSIYAFRHADVELFEHRGERLAHQGARVTLQTNFRSRREILSVLNRAFADQLGDRFMPLAAGRTDQSAAGPLVELLIADKGAEWSADGLAAPWRVAEARALSARVDELLASGTPARDVVVLIRATGDMRAYERALEERGIATYTVGGRGYWSHPQVVDLVAYLRALANPRDEEALYSTLGSPLVGASADALVLLAAAARGCRRDPWWVLREPDDLLDGVASDDRLRLEGFASWVAAERGVAPRKGVDELLERALEQTGYDLTVLGMPGGQRRLANVRKLMRLGREHMAARGPDLRGFLDLVRIRSESWRPDPDESEAPVESEALDAVRLMTIHRAKGLEFEVVCVADLGRGARWSADVLRVARDGRLGLRLARPGTGGRESALWYEELGEERAAAEAREERRLFYVAMTRARERLILSGAAKLDGWADPGSGGSPISWLGPALVPDIEAGAGESGGVRFTVIQPPGQDAGDLGQEVGAGVEPSEGPPAVAPPPATDASPPPEPPPPTQATQPTEPPPPEAHARPVVASLSYTSLAAYQRCGYRFYVERLLGVPGPEGPAAPSGQPRDGSVVALTAAERGTVVHALLEQLDFRRPIAPSEAAILAVAPRPPEAAELAEIGALVKRFADTELRARLARATRVRREQRFGFLLGGTLITGMLDVIANEPGNRTLVVDYKTDRLQPLALAGSATGRRRAEPATVVESEYATQRLIYALAALRAGAEAVDVVHVFLEAPDDPVSATFTREDEPELERRLAEISEGVVRKSSFAVTDTPHRGICDGCPAEGGLCSWPLAMTRREAPDRLF